jgi:hypothetical protein
LKPSRALRAADGLGSLGKATENLVADTAQATHGIYEFADAYEVVEREEKKVETQTRRLSDVFRAINVSAADVNRLPETISGVGAASAGASRGAINLQQNFTAASYAFQDFASAGGDVGMKLNAITNNIPMILSGLGGLGTAVSLVSVAGISLYRNWDTVATLWRDRNPFLFAAQTADQMAKAVERSKDELEKLHQQASAPNWNWRPSGLWRRRRRPPTRSRPSARPTFRRRSRRSAARRS